MTGLRRFSGRLGLAITTCASAGFLAGRLHSWHWRCEQLCHFTCQYFWLLTAAATLLAFGGWRKLAAFAAVLAGANLALIAPLYIGPGQQVASDAGPARSPQATNDSPEAQGKSDGSRQAHTSGSDGSAVDRRLKLVSVNVLTANLDHERVLRFIDAEQPDLVLLMEVNERWRRALSGSLPNEHFVAREDNFGMAMLSRLPFAEIEAFYPADARVPAIRARIEARGRTWTIYGCHPLPPVSADYARSRDEYLAEIGDLAAERSSSSMILGDLNTTSWSGAFADLVDRSRLIDSRAGYGIQATWSPGSGLSLIPIDHCLVPPGTIVRERRVGPDIGSDHRPIVVSIQ